MNPHQSSQSATPLPRGLIILVLGLLSMLMPLSIDMYLPSMPTIAKEYGVADGLVQLTISSYLLGFAFGQLIYGPLSDSFGRKPVLLFGLLLFTLAAVLCGFATSANQLIALRFLHGLAAAATAVVVSAFMRDVFHDRDEFSRMNSFVSLVSNLAPLLAPILGGIILIWFRWQMVFYVLALISVFALILIGFMIPETLPTDKRSKLNLNVILRNFVTICRHPQVRSFMLLGAFSGAGLFAFLSLGPFVYMDIYGVQPDHFGYYFALNIVIMVGMNVINSRFVKQKGAFKMLTLGMVVQAISSLYLLLAVSLQLGFIAVVAGVAFYIGCIAIIGGNVMAIILSHYAYMAGTAASLVGTFRFVIASFIGIVLAWLSSAAQSSPSPAQISEINHAPEYIMAGSMIVCNVIACLFYVAVKRKNSRLENEDAISFR